MMSRKIKNLYTMKKNLAEKSFVKKYVLKGLILQKYCLSLKNLDKKSILQVTKIFKNRQKIIQNSDFRKN